MGKNGVGKTTLVRAINNLRSTDTYQKTASPYIFTENSQIVYKFGTEVYEFNFNKKLNLIDTKEIISDKVKGSIFVELPMPHGKRFSHFQKLGSIDEELRKSISIGTYTEPSELIKFLNEVYTSNRFEHLKEFSFRGEKYYFILKENDYYIREDYFSSGEYFVVSLYKMIQSRKKCITIDEIDISLDAHAQVNLIEQLRVFCQQYEVNIVFTTHSLPLMKTLNNDELFYMEQVNGSITVESKSYNYIKGLLFGFHGWDKYILTEDEVLKNYLEYTIISLRFPVFYKYKVIYIGGATQVVDLMKRNDSEHFLTEPDNVLSVLDGDQSGKGYVANKERVIFIPYESVEKDLYKFYQEIDPLIPRLENKIVFSKKHPEKTLFNELTKPRNKLMSEIQIFEFLDQKKQQEVADFKQKIAKFLGVNDA